MGDPDSILFSTQAGSNPHFQKFSNHKAEWLYRVISPRVCPLYRKIISGVRVKSQHGSTCVQGPQLRRGAWACVIFLPYMPNSYLNFKWPAQDHTSRLWRVFLFLKCCCGKVWYSKWCNNPSLSSHTDCNIRVIPVTQGKHLELTCVNTRNNTDNTYLTYNNLFILNISCCEHCAITHILTYRILTMIM